MTVCVHMCRGNHAGGWFAEGGYDPVAEISFSRIDVDGFFLEYDTPRAGSFAPLRFLAKDKVAVLGLVTTKSPALESKDQLKRRIDEASKHVPLDRLCAEPAMRLREHDRGQSADPGRPETKAAACRRDRKRGVGL